jgi:hypothetical protein
MNELFEALLFPRERQDRGPDPGPFPRRPHAYKPHLRLVFRAKCCYCRMPDGLKGYEGFGIDHYLPKSRFPHLQDLWSNLFYACNVCNAWKGEWVPTSGLFLPNPCDHWMADHLQYQGSDVETYTPQGDWLVELLHLGDTDRRELRDLLLSALGRFLEARCELLADLAAFEAGCEDAARVGEADLQAAIRETVEELDKVERLIERLTGERIRRLLAA